MRLIKPHSQEWLCYFRASRSAFSIVPYHGVLQVGAVQLDVGQIDFAEAGERQVRAGKISAAKICLPQNRPAQNCFVQFRGAQVSAKQFRAAQIGFAQIRAFEPGFREIAISQIRPAQVRPAQIRVAEFRSAQVGFPQVAAREVGAGQIAFLQIRAGKIGAGKIGAFPARMPFMEFFVRVQNVLELFAFMSNGLRLPRPQAPPGNRTSGLTALPSIDSSERPFYRIRRDAQTCDNLGVE